MELVDFWCLLALDELRLVGLTLVIARLAEFVGAESFFRSALFLLSCDLFSKSC